MSSLLALQLKNKKAVVLGGGTVAERKVRFLLNAEADVTVISPDLMEGLLSWKDQFHYIEMSVNETDFDHSRFTEAFILVAATSDPYLNGRAADSLANHVPLINSVDHQEKSSFFFPALVERGDLKIGISTSGASPVLAKTIKEEIENLYGHEYAARLERLRAEREKVKRTVTSREERKNRMHELTDDDGEHHE